MHQVTSKAFSIQPNVVVDHGLVKQLAEMPASPSPEKKIVKELKIQADASKFVYKEKGLETLPSYMKPTESSLAKSSPKASPEKVGKIVQKSPEKKSIAPKLEDFLAKVRKSPKASPIKATSPVESPLSSPSKPPKMFTSLKDKPSSRFAISRPKLASPPRPPILDSVVPAIESGPVESGPVEHGPVDFGNDYGDDFGGDFGGGYSDNEAPVSETVAEPLPEPIQEAVPEKKKGRPPKKGNKSTKATSKGRSKPRAPKQKIQIESEDDIRPVISGPSEQVIIIERRSAKSIWTGKPNKTTVVEAKAGATLKSNLDLPDKTIDKSLDSILKASPISPPKKKVPIKSTQRLPDSPKLSDSESEARPAFINKITTHLSDDDSSLEETSFLLANLKFPPLPKAQ